VSAIFAHLALNAAISAACFLLLWLAGLRLKDVSFIDSWWGLGIGVIALASYHETAAHGAHNKLLLGLTEAWALRLGLYLIWRWQKNGPDPRYTRLLARVKMSFALGTLLYVFALQFVLQFVVSLPVQIGQWGTDGIGPAGIAGAVLALFGLAFESIADWQLVRFKSELANRGRVLDRGLWRYSRHPNHFGDACVWWGLYLIATESAWGLWTLPAPVVMTYLLARWSGVPTVEGRMRRHPGHADYVARTSAFVPWFPKKAG
jgi:steroid 5-alpha reductase family enzyme